MLEVAIQTEQRITSTEVPAGEQLIVSIFVLTRLADVSRSREHMRMAVLLRNYALQHPSATTIFRAID